jgi:hypothetical protein
MTTKPLPHQTPVVARPSAASPAPSLLVRLGDRAARWAPVSGLAFAIFFVAGVVASNVPADSASDRAWLAAYSSAHSAGHLATAYSLVFAGLSLATFLCTLWMRVLHARSATFLSPVPLLAAAVAGSCMAAGGVLMGVVSVAPLRGYPQIIRLGSDGGFAMVGVGAMLAASLSVACLSVMALGAGVLGRRMAWFGIVVSVVLLGGIFFVPIAALIVWTVATAIVLLRRPQVAHA